MASTFTWLDHSEEARRKALDAIDIFRQSDTREELGLGGIRDAIAGVFSPGTSTIQTRARYFLLIPWIYQRLEPSRSSVPAAARARSAELDMIEVLRAGGDTSGLIGQQAGRNLKRLPSGVYWQGLQAWGVRGIPTSQDAYHRWIDAGKATSISTSDDDGETVKGIWHSSLPSPPADFPYEASLTLLPNEAEYLSERIQQRSPNSLMAWLLRHDDFTGDIAMPWEHPRTSSMPSRLQKQLHHARLFSESMHGAQLLYNLLLARQRRSEPLAKTWTERLSEWQEALAASADEIDAWDMKSFWQFADEAKANVSPMTRMFADRWVASVTGRDGTSSVGDDDICCDLVRSQEIHVKGAQARLANRSMLEAWGGDSGSAQLSYRWGVTSSYVDEIVEALRA